MFVVVSAIKGMFFNCIFVINLVVLWYYIGLAYLMSWVHDSELSVYTKPPSVCHYDIVVDYFDFYC